jgi:hypothetical protein
MTDFRCINRHHAALSQARALAIFARYMALASNEPKNNHAQDTMESTRRHYGIEVRRQNSPRQRLNVASSNNADPQAWRTHTHFHSYLLTWL